MFPRSARIRPSRAASLAGAVVGLVILVAAAGAGAPPFFLVVAMVVVALNLFNAIGPGVATEVVEFDNGPGAAPGAGHYCTACGAAVPAGARFCASCGHALGA